MIAGRDMVSVTECEGNKGKRRKNQLITNGLRERKDEKELVGLVHVPEEAPNINSKKDIYLLSVPRFPLTTDTFRNLT